MNIEILAYFLRLGSIGFGGPLALIGMMQKDLVEDKKWISDNEFKQAFSLIKAMPGPIAFQTAVYLGKARAGFWGGTMAGFGLVLPAFLMMILFGYFYEDFKSILWAQKLLTGMQASALVMVAFGLKSLVKPYFKIFSYWFLLLIALILSVYSALPEPIIILGGAGLWTLLKQEKNKFHFMSAIGFFEFDLEKIQKLTWICFKAGAFVFGTGLAAIPIFESGFVDQLHWMTHSQFMDAIAAGQITPGPVVISATFIGFKTAGFWGALLATIAIFGPAYFHMITWFSHAVSWLSKQKWISDFTFAAIALVVGILTLTIYKLLGTFQGQPLQYFIFVICFVLALKTNLPSWALILSGGLMNLFLDLFHF